MAKPLDIIGTTELINLIDQDFLHIPAKIDTGADSSAIWASNITLENNLLKFSLFGVGSGFYTGEIISASDFRVITVKNSFGTLELRYKVPINIQVGARKIRGWFNLADRSTMRYPVLLGRRSLKNKFVVDVSKRTIHASTPKKSNVLILSSLSDGMSEFAAQIKVNLKSKAEVHVATFNDLRFYVNGEKTVVEVAYEGKNLDLASYGLVYFKSHKRYTELAKAAATYLSYKNVHFFDKELLEYTSYDKLTEYLKLSLYGISVPPLFAGTKQSLQLLLNASEDIDYPVVYKEINADRGRDNFFIASKEQLKTAIDSSEPTKIYVIQRFIPNNGYLRIFNFGNTSQLIVGRAPVAHKDPSKQHLNNPAGSKNASLIPAKQADKAAVELAVRASVIMNRQVSGVDLIQDKTTKLWYVLEVNNAPQLKTGSYITEKITALSKFIDNELNR